jgi:hypothetical protein
MIKLVGFYWVETLKFILAAFFYTLGRKPWIAVIPKLEYRRSRNRIEIDLTYACNLKCLNCNRSCSQAPSEERITVGQIKKFVKESIENNVKWERIRLIGGEPTLHPDILEIVYIILEYNKRHSPETNIQLITNGFGPRVNKILEKVPQGISIENSNKKSVVQLFCSFNVAPQDYRNYRTGDYESGCVNCSICGISLTPYGYYCCGVAGGIDRIFGLNIGRKSLPLVDDDMRDHLRAFCKLCGIFASFKLVRKEAMSVSWQKAYERYRKNRPKLTHY